MQAFYRGKNGLCTLCLSHQQEIKILVKRRTNFEYALKRKKPVKSDFLNYIEYEEKFFELKKKRIERKAKSLWSKKYKPVLITGRQRMLRILNRTCAKFPNGTVWFNLLLIV